MYQAIIIFHVIMGISIITLVLLQQGKGAEAGAAFGGGASGSVFGARGAASFLTRATALLATLFFCSSLSLAYLSGTTSEKKDIMDAVEAVNSTGDLPAVLNEESVEQNLDMPGDLPPVSIPDETENAIPAPGTDIDSRSAIEESAQDLPPGLDSGN